MDIKATIKKNTLKIVLIPLGGLIGFLYWRFVGCESGTCPIKSVWYWSTLYGLIFGYLISDIILSYTNKRKDKQSESSVEEGGKV